MMRQENLERLKTAARVLDFYADAWIATARMEILDVIEAEQCAIEAAESAGYADKTEEDMAREIGVEVTAGDAVPDMPDVPDWRDAAEAAEATEEKAEIRADTAVLRLKAAGKVFKNVRDALEFFIGEGATPETLAACAGVETSTVAALLAGARNPVTAERIKTGLGIQTINDKNDKTKNHGAKR